MKNKENVKTGTNAGPDGIVMQTVASLMCIVIGALLLFVPDVNILYMCYSFCAALIIAGIVLIVSYFVSGAYRKLNDYRFAAGVMMVILGCIELLRAQILAEELMFIIGLVTLVLAVIILQSTVQMKILDSSTWVVQLIFTVLSLVGAVVVLVEFRPVLDRIDGFAYWVMLIVGALCLISLIIEAIVLWSVGRKEAKAAKETEATKETEAAKETEAEKQAEIEKQAEADKEAEDESKAEEKTEPEADKPDAGDAEEEGTDTAL